MTRGSSSSCGGSRTGTTGPSPPRSPPRSRTSSRGRSSSALARDLLGQLVLGHVRAARDLERLGLFVELVLALGVLEGVRVRTELEVVDLGALGVGAAALGVGPALLALDVRVGLGELLARRLRRALLGGVLAGLGARLLGLGAGVGARELVLGVALALLLLALPPQILVAGEVAGRLLDPARHLVQAHRELLRSRETVFGARTRAAAALTAQERRAARPRGNP